MADPGYHPVQIDRVVVQPIANLDLALGGSEAIDAIAAQVMTDCCRRIDDAGNRPGVADEFECLDVIVAGVEQHAIGHRRSTIHAHVAMHNGLTAKFLNGANGVEAGFEPFVFLPTTVVVRAEVVVIDFGGVTGDEVFVAPLAAQIDDVGDALVDPSVKLCFTDFWSGGFEVAANGEPIVDVAEAPMPGGRV